MIWFNHTQGLDSNTMREIADLAKVSWDYQPIVYRGGGIGYKNGNSDDEEAVLDTAETLLGYRPTTIGDPPEPESNEE